MILHLSLSVFILIPHCKNAPEYRTVTDYTYRKREHVHIVASQYIHILA